MNPQDDVKNLTELILQSVDINLTVTLNGEILRIYAQMHPVSENVELSQFVGKSIFEYTNLDLVKKINEAILLSNQEDRFCEGIINFSTPSGVANVFYAIMPLGNKTFFVYLTQQSSKSIELHYQLIMRLFVSLYKLETLEEGARELVFNLSKFDPSNEYGIYLFDESGNPFITKFPETVKSETSDLIIKILRDPENWQLINRGISFIIRKEDISGNQISNIFSDYAGFGFYPILFSGKLMGCYLLLTHTSFSQSSIEFIEEYARESGIILSRIRDYQLKDEQNQIFHSILDASDEILFVVNNFGTPFFYSPKFFEYLKADPNAYEKENILTFIDPSQQDLIKDIFENPLLIPNIPTEILLKSPVGIKWNLEIQLSAIRTTNQVLILAKEKNPDIESSSFIKIPSQQMLEITTKLPLPFLIVNQHSFRIAYANQFFHDYLHYQPDELLNKIFFDLFSPSENINLINIIKSGGIENLESTHTWKLKTKDQTDVLSRFVVTLITFENQKSFIVFLRDFSNELHSQLIKEPQAIYQIEPEAKIICKISADGILIQANQAYCDLVGKPVERIIGRPLQENLFLEDYEEVFQHFTKLTPYEPIRKHSNRMLNKLGKIHWVEWTDQGIFEGDQLIEIHAFGRDITEEYQNELLQISTEQRYQALVENLPMIIYVFHVKTLFPVYISPQITKITGYTATDFYNKPEFMLELFHPDERNEIDEKFRLKITENQPAPFEFRIIHKDGRVRWVEESGSNIFLPDGTRLYQGIFRDVTGRHLAREKLLYYSKFERLINKIAIRLMDSTPETASSELEYTVEELGNFMQVDRSYIFDFDHKSGTMSNIYEWCREGIPPMIDHLQNLPFSLFPWWMDQMNKNLEIAQDDLAKAQIESEQEKTFLLDQGIKSLLVVPLFHQGKPQGFIGFDMVNNHTHWEEESINLLRLVSSMIISTFKRFLSE